MARTREELEIVWKTITRDVRRFEGEAGISTVNSERWTTVDEALGELAAFLVDEVSDYMAPGEQSTEAGELIVLTQDIWEVIEKMTIDWAIRIEAARDAERQAREVIAA